MFTIFIMRFIDKSSQFYTLQQKLYHDTFHIEKVKTTLFSIQTFLYGEPSWATKSKHQGDYGKKKKNL